MKYLIVGLTRVARLLAQILGMGALGSVALAGLVAFRHILATPQPLESPLPGDAHLYRWKHGHIYYKVLGEQHAPSMVLLHSPDLAASAYEWHTIISSLATRYRVYAPDLLGFGLSDRPDMRYTATIYTQLLHDFLTDVVTEPATLVASRLACNYAITVGAESPNLCTRLVLLSPTALHGNQHDVLSMTGAKVLEAGQIRALLYPLLVATARLFNRLKYGQPERVITRSLTSSSDDTSDYQYATTHQFGAEHAPMAWIAGDLASDVTVEIEKLLQPALIIWGTSELQNARHSLEQQGNDTPGPNWSAAHTQMVLLQRSGATVHEELPESVIKTIFQWDEASIKSAVAVDDDDTVKTPAVVKPRVEAYCMKCKEKRGILHAREVTMKNGRIAVQGECEVCGTQLFRMGRLIPGYPNTPV